MDERDKRFQNRAKLRAKEREKLKTALPHTKKSGGNFKDRLNTYFTLHGQALFSSLGRLLKTPFTTIMTIMVLAIAIGSAAGFYVLLANVEQLTGNLENTNQISLFLKADVTDAAGQYLMEDIRHNSAVQSVTFMNRENALAEFKQFSGFSDAIAALDSNPLPAVIQVLPKNVLKDPEELESLVTEFKKLPQVDIAQLDMQWVRKLQSMVALIRRGMVILSCAIGFAVVFIMGNTIRLELEGRREEVLISKLVGATHSFIQRPYLYTGFWFGFLAGSVAWFMVTTMLLILKQPIENLLMLYDKDYSVIFFSFSESFSLLGMAALLGVVGAKFVLSYQLRQMKLE
jgi:cell division transport system permease protein